MKLLNFTIIKLSMCLAIGICIGYYIDTSIALSSAISTFLFVVLCLALTRSNSQFIKTPFFGTIAFLTTLSLGILVVTIHNQKNFKSHYSQIQSSSSSTITFRIREQLKSSLYHHKYVIDVLKIDNVSVKGKALLNIEKDSITSILDVDNILISNNSFEPVSKPLNPNQFDYKGYLERQYIYDQIFTRRQSLLLLSSKTHTLFGYAAQLRKQINLELNNYNFKSEELAIINALILGQRQDIGKAIYDNYINAGAVHILAVSGLHVGIVLLLLNFVLKPIEFLKYGKTIKVIIILLLLWSFASIAGLSASVTRAVTMFSIVAIAMHLKRPTNIYNTLAISLFILLLFKPLFLFDVGFQLSYLAVLAIVSIQPILYRLWQPRLKLINYLWQIFTVTLAAQFGVVPISLYYFHQFPGLFFVSNLAIIPFLGFILSFGIIIIVLALAGKLPEFLADFYGTIISWMNTLVNWISKQEAFLLKDIAFNLLQVLASYLIILSLVRLLKKRNYNALRFTLISVICFQCAVFYTNYQNRSHAFIIFHKSRFSILAQKSNNWLKVYHNLDSLSYTTNNALNNYKVGNSIDNLIEDSLQAVYSINNKSLLVIDSLGVYKVKTFKPHYVLLRNSPKLNLERLIDSLNPELIIADGSNYKSYVKRWETTCKTKKCPFHYTGEKGAFCVIE